MSKQIVSGKDFIIKDLTRKIRYLEAENSALHTQIDRITEERDYVQYCLDETKKSFSYRLGYMLTVIPRKIRKYGN